jgi:hypothetical protein
MSMWDDIFSDGGLDVTQKALASPEGMATYNAIPAWKNPNVISSALGNVARAIAPGSWQGVVGGMAGDLGTSNIANINSKSESLKREGLNNKTLSMLGNILNPLLSQDGKTGGTKMTIGSDGKFHFIGDWKDAEPLTEGGNDIGIKNESNSMGGMGEGLKFDYGSTLNPQDGGTTSPFQGGQTGDVGSVYRFGLNPEQIAEQDKLTMAGEQAGVGNYLEGAKLASQIPLLKAHAAYYNAEASPQMQMMKYLKAASELQKTGLETGKLQLEIEKMSKMLPLELQGKFLDMARTQGMIKETGLDIATKSKLLELGVPGYIADKAKSDAEHAGLQVTQLQQLLNNPEMIKDPIKRAGAMQESYDRIFGNPSTGAHGYGADDPRSLTEAGIYNSIANSDTLLMPIPQKGFGSNYWKVSPVKLPIYTDPKTKKSFQVTPEMLTTMHFKNGVPLETLVTMFGLNIPPGSVFPGSAINKSATPVGNILLGEKPPGIL